MASNPDVSSNFLIQSVAVFGCRQPTPTSARSKQHRIFQPSLPDGIRQLWHLWWPAARKLTLVGGLTVLSSHSEMRPDSPGDIRGSILNSCRV